jgi:aminocarboxymuconate-semialdehyde decarboxylase
MFSYWTKPENTLDLSKYLNDNIAQTVAENPKRFAGLGTIPMNSPELAVKEVHRLKDDLGLQGVQIGTNVLGKNLDHEDLFPIFEECADADCCVFVHPWDMIGEERMPNYWLPWLVAMPAETSLAICSMIFGGVLERLPNLKVAFAHGGGSFPATLGRIEQGFRVRPDLCAARNDKNPKSYVGKFWLDSLTHDEHMLRKIVDMWGAKRCMFGTDYPFPLGEYVTTAPGNLIEKAFPGDLAKQADIFQNSALEFLGLDRDRFLE